MVVTASLFVVRCGGSLNTSCFNFNRANLVGTCKARLGAAGLEWVLQAWHGRLRGDWGSSIPPEGQTVGIDGLVAIVYQTHV